MCLRRHVRGALAGLVRGAAALLVTAGLAACSGANEHPGFVGATGDEAGAEPHSTGSHLGVSGGGDGTCAALEQTAHKSYRPIDVIFVVDNSASMGDEIAQIEARINHDFANIMAESGLDYRVVLVSRYGKAGSAIGKSANPICVEAPLGTGDCADPEHTPLTTGERFFHFSADVASHNAWCVLLGAFAAPDEYGDVPRSGWTTVAPNGYGEFLRPEAFKVFVVIGDDDVRCELGGQRFDDLQSADAGEVSAGDFDRALLRLSPGQFGTERKRNYVWHSIVGLAEPTPSHTAWLPNAPIQTARCSQGSEGPATGHQALSRLTSGLRYPSCDSANFDAVFDTIADGIVAKAELDCTWQIPEAPSGQDFDKGRVNVRYTPGEGSPPESILQAKDAASCGRSGGWYYDDAEQPHDLIACPTTCDHIRGSATGRIEVLFGCATEVVVVR
jgi:hypothetical protein